MSNILIDTEYIQKLSNRLPLFKKVRNNLWNCRCPICGDSQKKKFKKRFYIFLNDGKYLVKCHNCGYTNLFSIFLKNEFPDIYNEYSLKQLKNSSFKKNRFNKHLKKIIPQKVTSSGFDYDSLKRFSKLSQNHPARIYTEKRKIPFNLVYYSDNFSLLLSELHLDKYKLTYEKSSEPRMIIPFYREDGLSTVFQARAFSKKEYLRYITIKENDSESKIYGMERVNKNKIVYYTEGPIDSMMIPNTLAMSGISTKLPKGIQDWVFIYDNEPRNYDVVKNMRKRLTAGHKVVIFSDCIKYNDLNDMVVKGNMNSEQIMKIIQENTYQGNEGIMKLHQWKKI